MAAKEILDLSKCNTSFGLDLFKKLVSSNKGENVFFSPYSIFSALAMTSLGAKNETLNQLRKALKLEDIPEKLAHKLFSEMNKSIMETCNKCTLHIANRLYGEKSYNFLKKFLVDCKECYGAGLEAVDFNYNASACEKEINDWVSLQTMNKIKNLIKPDTLDNFTKLVLINAIYFKGDWNQKFEVSQTKECDFHISANHSIKVQMMHMKKAKLNYEYNYKLHCQVLELPYVGKSISMFILLPDLKVTTLEELEISLCSEDLNEISSWEMELNVWLPRFKVEQLFELKSVLEEMGAKDLFDVRTANFSGMCGTPDLFVTKVFHKAFIEVNEEGSEAAATTAVEITDSCAAFSPDPLEFRADHPFIFLLKDNITKSILFFGHLNQP